MLSFNQFKKVVLVSLFALSLIHCGGSSTPAPINGNTSPSPLTPRSSTLPKYSPRVSSPAPSVPESSSPDVSRSPRSGDTSEDLSVDEFADAFVSAICEVAHACDSRIQLTECSRYLQNEGGDQIWDNLGINVEDLEAFVDALEAGSIVVSESNLQSCAQQFDNQCRVPNPALIGGSYQNIENVIPETFACENIFVSSNSITPPTPINNNAVEPGNPGNISSPSTPPATVTLCPRSEQPTIVHGGQIEPVPAPGYANPMSLYFTDNASNESSYITVCYESACNLEDGLPQNVNAALSVRTSSAVSGTGGHATLYTQAFRLGQTYCCGIRAITPTCSLNDAQGQIIPFAQGLMNEYRFNE